jgi:hypothetical protein
VATGSFGLSVELHPSNPTHSVTPTLAKTARTQPMRSPCGITFPSPGFLLVSRHPCQLTWFLQIVLGHSGCERRNQVELWIAGRYRRARGSKRSHSCTSTRATRCPIGILHARQFTGERMTRIWREVLRIVFEIASARQRHPTIVCLATAESGQSDSKYG